MTLHQIHNVQLCLKDKGEPHLPLDDIHMAVALMQMKNDKGGGNAHVFLTHDSNYCFVLYSAREGFHTCNSLLKVSM